METIKEYLQVNDGQSLIGSLLQYGFDPQAITADEKCGLISIKDSMVHLIDYKANKTKPFNFGVLDFSKTLDNHSVRLRKYRESCNKTPGLKYDFTLDQDAAYKRELNQSQYAAKILNSMGFTANTTRRNVRTRVNGYFYLQIANYLHRADLPASWATAVYLDCYDELNEFMEVVAEVVWVRIK